MSAPTSVPIIGQNAKVSVTGSGSAVVLLNSNWKITQKAIVAEIPNTTDGTRRISGRKDYNGTVEGWQDTAAPVEGDFAVGDTVTLKMFTDGTKFYSLAAIIESLDIETGVDDPIKWTLTWSMAYGTLTLPA